MKARYITIVLTLFLLGWCVTVQGAEKTIKVFRVDSSSFSYKRIEDTRPDLRPFVCQISPTVLSEDTLTLELEYKSDGRRQTRGPVKAAHGATILVLLDSQSDVYHAVLVTPRIVTPD
jgi:hypothetical protein